ncbi:MAG: zinc ribbon domain-containing protein [Candidatus Hodarchaeales archaeon]
MNLFRIFKDRGMTICPFCNEILPERAKFCPKCGGEVNVHPPWNKGILLIQVASLILLVQNLLISLPAITVISLLDPSNFMFYSAVSILFYVDIIGFLLLGFGYMAYPTENPYEKKIYLTSSFCIILWVICRGIWQFLITNNQLGNLYNFMQTPTGAMGIFEILGQPLPDIKFPLLIGGLALGSASIFLFRIRKEPDRRMFMNYGIINMIAVCLISLPIIIYDVYSFIAVDSVTPLEITAVMVYSPYFGLLLKLLVIPLLGALTFLRSFQKTQKSKKMIHSEKN